MRDYQKYLEIPDAVLALERKTPHSFVRLACFWLVDIAHIFWASLTTHLKNHLYFTNQSK